MRSLAIRSLSPIILDLERLLKVWVGYAEVYRLRKVEELPIRGTLFSRISLVILYGYQVMLRFVNEILFVVKRHVVRVW